MADFFHVMTLPFLACLILTGIHAYLGLHVIEREVIFVDLSLAQIAALGSAVPLFFGRGNDDPAVYWTSLGFTLAGSALFSFSRFRKSLLPQEAVIGIVYAVSAALLTMVLSRIGEGDEHIRRALLGNLLLVTPPELWKLLFVYGAVGLFHFAQRGRFLLISQDPEQARRIGIRVRGWDFLFYATFGVVVTSSVRLAGVLLVFAYLVVPAATAVLFAQAPRTRLFMGWGVGFLSSVLGLWISYGLDFPTAASVVCALGATFTALFIFRFARSGRGDGRV